MSQTSAPKRHVIEVADIVDDEVVTRRLYAVYNVARQPRRHGDGGGRLRVRKALLKRLVKQVKRLNGRRPVIGV